VGLLAVMRQPLTWSLGLVLSAHALPAQTLPPDSLLDRLVGRWVLRGTIARQQTTHDVTFEWMLGRRYVQMHEVSPSLARLRRARTVCHLTTV